ncbi:MAG TPA: hypothetical protein VNL71_10285 [Chloroflexota bacterium]|nr:hypothetical protein [Chloroflexota bacterium]
MYIVKNGNFYSTHSDPGDALIVYLVAVLVTWATNLTFMLVVLAIKLSFLVIRLAFRLCAALIAAPFKLLAARRSANDHGDFTPIGGSAFGEAERISVPSSQTGSISHVPGDMFQSN